MLASIITLGVHVEQEKNNGKDEFDAKYPGCSTYILLEAVENYGGSPLQYSIDAVEAFRNKVGSATESSEVCFTTWYNDWAWPSDWWTKEWRDTINEGPISYRHYAVFDGHGGITTISFSVSKRDVFGQYRNYADFTMTSTSNGELYIMAHPRIKTRWIILASCSFLRFYSEETKNKLIRYGFNGGKPTYDLSNTYLHGIVGMKSTYSDTCSDWWCSNCDINSPTLREFAEKLIQGKSIKEAWFIAVSNNQKCGCFIWCDWTGKAAVIYPRIYACEGTTCTLIYDPGTEGMEPFSEPLPSPKIIYESIPPGVSFNIVWVYEYQG